MSGKPSVPISVVMPVYNGAKFLKEAIRSVLEQKAMPAELVILDNASTDATPQIIDGFRDVPFLKVYRNEQLLPPIDNWHKAVTLSTCPYFTVLPHDDLLLPEALSTAWEVLSQHPEVGFFLCLGWQFTDPNNNVSAVRLCEDPSVRGLMRRESLVNRMIEKGQFYPGQGAVVKREAFDLVGGFDPSIRFHGDYELYLRLAGMTDSYGYFGALALDRTHPQQGRANVYFDDSGDTERIFFKIGQYSFLSEEQRRNLARELCMLPYQHYTRKLQDPSATISDIVERRRKTAETIARRRRSGEPYAKYVPRLPISWRPKIVWVITGLRPGLWMVRQALRVRSFLRRRR